MSKNIKIQEGLKTKKDILKKARRLFTKGYENISTPELAENIGLTRGAIYHHFKNKKHLFESVVIEIAKEITSSINDVAETQVDAVESIVSGSLEFIRYCQKKDVRKIYLEEAPAILGWKRWREIDEEHSLGSLIEGIKHCYNQGLISKEQIIPIAYLISGSLNEAVFLTSEKQLNNLERTALEKGIIKNIKSLLT